MTLAEQVEDRIGDVERALANAIGELEDRWYQSDAVEASVSALRSLRGPINLWATNGRSALPSGTPGKAGWPGWLKAGDTHLAGIAEIQGLATSETLENLELTAAGVRDDSVKLAKRAGETAKKTLMQASAAVGESAGAIARPLALPLGLLAIGLVAVAVIAVKVRS